VGCGVWGEKDIELELLLFPPPSFFMYISGKEMEKEVGGGRREEEAEVSLYRFFFSRNYVKVLVELKIKALVRFCLFI